MQLTKDGLFGLYVSIMGLIAGSLVYSILGTLRVFILQPPEVTNLSDWLLAPALVFMGSLPWAVIGAVLFVLPQSILVSLTYLLSSRNNKIPASVEPYVWLPMFFILYFPVFYFGFREQHIDAAILGVACLAGLRIALILLRRLEMATLEGYPSSSAAFTGHFDSE
jgi:hypothetical protein